MGTRRRRRGVAFELIFLPRDFVFQAEDSSSKPSELVLHQIVMQASGPKFMGWAYER